MSEFPQTTFTPQLWNGLCNGDLRATGEQELLRRIYAWTTAPALTPSATARDAWPSSIGHVIGPANTAPSDTVPA